MDTDDGGAPARRLDRQPHRGRIAPARLGDAGQPADEALARRADHDWIAGIGQARRIGDQGHILLDALAEAEARIEGDTVAGDPRCLAGFGTLHQEAANLLDDVGVSRNNVLVLRPAAAVHQHDRYPAPSDQRQQLRIILERRDVVHDPRAGIQAGTRHRGTARVDGDDGVALGQALDDRQDALQFLIRCGRPRAGARGLATDIDDVGALRNKTQAIVDGLRGVEVLSAVGEGIGCDVQDRHQPDAVERKAGEGRRQTPGCGSGLAPPGAPVPWPELVGTEARRRRSEPVPAPPVSSRTTFSPRRTVPISSLLSVSYSSSALAIRCRSSRRSVRIWRALPSASSIRRRTSWSISWAVASETFCVWVTAWPRNTSCSFA